jgi:hypothetical protein
MLISSLSSADSTEASRLSELPIRQRSLITTRTVPSPGEQRLFFSAFGVGFTITSVCDRLLRDSLKYLPPSRTKAVFKFDEAVSSVAYRLDSLPGAGSTFILTRDGRELSRCYDRTDFLERFGSIVALHVADNSRKWVFIHAGVVGWGGFAIVIPGRSFSGKTTLVAELVRAGASYYSDEFAVIDRQGRVFPYPQPLQLRDPRTFRQTRCPVERLGGIIGGEPLPIGVVLFSKYEKGASWLPQKLSQGIGCLQMLNNTISARSAPAIALRTLNQVVSEAVMVKGLRGDASTIIQWITAQFGPLRSN